MVREVTLIYSDDAIKGEGTEEDPVRALYKLFTKDGAQVAHYDARGASWFNADRLHDAIRDGRA